MKDNIRFLVLWVGTSCSLKCRDCCNLIPYLPKESYDIESIFTNLEYITEEMMVELLQIQGGEPLTHQEIDYIIKRCALNSNISKIEVATNGTIMPSKKTIDVLKEYSDKITLRFSNYGCTMEKQRYIKDELKKNGINVQGYEFVYETGEWFNLGSVYDDKEVSQIKVEETYKKCPNKSCWTLSKNLFAGCGRMIAYLQLKDNESIIGNNILDISMLIKEKKRFIEEFQIFERRYNTCASDLCGYCRTAEELIPAAVQLTAEELSKFGVSKRI